MSSPGVALAGPEGNDPAIAFDVTGTLWVAWTVTQPGAPRGEDERAGPESALVDGLVCQAMALSGSDVAVDPTAIRGRWTVREPEGIALDPVLSAPPDQAGVWLAWATRRSGRWIVRAALLEGEEGPAHTSLDTVDLHGAPEGAFSPAILALSGRQALVAFEGVTGKSRRIRVALVTPEGATWLTEPDSENRGEEYRPALGRDGSGRLWVIYEATTPLGTCDLWARSVDLDGRCLHPAVKLVDHPADDMHPAVAPAQNGGFWLAWTSNRRGDGVDLPHWVYLARFHEGHLVEGPVPAFPPQEPDEVAAVQGWEFADILTDRHQRVWIAGRSSQTFFVQWYRGGTWSRRGELSGREWGCRSRRVRLALDGTGTPWAVFRGVREIRVQPLPELEATHEPAPIRCVSRSTSPIAYGRYALPMLPGMTRSRSSRRATRYEGKDLFTFFGDLHCHTAHSDGHGSLDEFYRRSRDLYGDDFGAVTDHDYVPGKVLTPSQWAYVCDTARHFNEPGRYVTFSAFEWTSPLHPRGSGHKHVILPVDDAPLFRHLEEGGLGGEAGHDGRALLAYVKRYGGVAIPHHVGWGGTDPEHHDPSVQPCFEICSTLGSYERQSDPVVPYVSNRVVDGSFLREFLRQGLRFGFVGGSDGHGLLWHHGVGWKRDGHRGGLTAVLAPHLDRASILDAIRARRCYATSGVPILLDVRLNGILMGGTTAVEPGSPIVIEVRVTGTAPIRAAYVVKDGDDVYRVEGGGATSFGFEYEERAFEGSSVKESFYYVRVVQQDGEAAWSSPVWVQCLDTGRQG